MSLSVGQHVWIPCEVKRGAFSDERMVLVNSPVVHSTHSRWIGFVPTVQLKDPIETGSTSVVGIVLDVSNDHFLAQVMGHALANSVLEDHISRAQPIGSLKT
jgi:hypothetical protein